MQYLRKIGMPVVDWTYCEDIEDAIDAAHELMAQRYKLPFEVDGVVIKINDIDLADALGVVGKDPRAPSRSNFQPGGHHETAEIGVNVGRTGVLTPYALLARWISVVW